MISFDQAETRARLIDYMTQNWHSHIDDSSRCVTFNLKALLTLENH